MEDSEEENEIREFCRDLVNIPTPTELLWTGSYFELPVKYFFNNMTDLDIIVCPRHICALPFNYKTTSNRSHHLRSKIRAGNLKGITVLWMYSNESHPGFTQLLRDWDISKRRRRYSRTDLRSDGGKKACVTLNLMRGSESIRGCFRWLNHMGNGIFDRNEITYDWVDAILCPVWPDVASEWINRERRYGWPSNDLIESVVKSGCFLVAKPHQNNADDACEWRISFSKAELSLIHSWSDVQMYVYHVLRLVKNDIVKKCGGSEICHLKTYHFKTLMLWACEEKEPAFWNKTDIESSLKELLCTMIEWLNRKECRNYFISDNNMFDYLPSDFCFENEIQNILLSVERIQFYTTKTHNLLNEQSSEVVLRIPNKLLLTMHLKFYHYYALSPSLTERKRYRPLESCEETDCFRSVAVALYKALCIHKDLRSCKTSSRPDMNAIDLALDRFRFCQTSTIDGHSITSVSSSENGHEIAKNILMTRILNTDDDIVAIPQLSSIADLTQLTVLALAQFLNEGIDHPVYFLSSAYLVNFHYTAFDDASTRSVDHWRQALSLSHHLICHYDDLTKKCAACGIQDRLLYVIISRKWIAIFDKYIQAVFGFYVLCNAFLNGNSRNVNGCVKNRGIVVHVNAVDFMKYVRIQCNRKLSDAEGIAIDDSNDIIQMRRLMFHNSTTALLYSALRSRYDSIRSLYD